MKELEQLARPLSQVCSTVDVVVSSYILYCKFCKRFSAYVQAAGCFNTLNNDSRSSVVIVAIIIAYLFYYYSTLL